ncbi:Myozenin [Trinorchestia longiramus]|nr:Myozenin [Trinorchestia longiramus]
MSFSFDTHILITAHLESQHTTGGKASTAACSTVDRQLGAAAVLSGLISGTLLVIAGGRPCPVAGAVFNFNFPAGKINYRKNRIDQFYRFSSKREASYYRISNSASNPAIRSNPNAFVRPNEENVRPVIPLKTAFRPTVSKQSSAKKSQRKTFSDPATPAVLKDRGLRPSDLSDPHKKEFLTNLTSRVFHLALEEDSNREKIPLERLFTPATDSGEITPRKKKAFASSDFYAPDHPTIDDQLQLAHKISGSLVDQTNKTSRGQAMYEKCKQRSEKWTHTDDGKLVQQEVQEDFQAQSSETFSTNDSAPKTKPAMKLVLNPKGVQDHTTVEQHYEQLMQESSSSSSGVLPSHIGPSHIPASPEIAKDIINDMQSPTGKGAALFAKRKKRMDKFIVDETNVQRSSAYQQQSVVVSGLMSVVVSGLMSVVVSGLMSVVVSGLMSVVNSSFEQSITNQVSSFSSSSTSSSSGVQQQQPQAAPAITAPPGSKKRLQQERDAQQQKIMSEFLNKRESQFQLVKSPWEAALEGNTASAFKQNTISTKMSSSFTSSSTASLGGPSTWLEGPKSVPVTAPVPKSNGGANLPNPPSPFARPTANGPATLPDISTILTTSNPTKSFKAGGVTITPTLNLNSHLASKPVSVRSPRSSSVGHKPAEKRLSTIPKAAQYPFPSYLSLASQQGGCVRSSSASSIPSLVASLSASNPVCGSDFNLKPGSPPIVVQPNHSDAHTNTHVKNRDNVVDESQSSVQNNFYKDVKLRKVQVKDTSAPASRPSSGFSAPVKNGRDSSIEGGKASASFRLSNSSSPYDFSANASAENEALKLMLQDEKISNSRSFISMISQEPNNFISSVSKPSFNASYPLKTTASLTPTNVENARSFKHDSSSSFQSTRMHSENKIQLNGQSSSLHRSKSFSNHDAQSNIGVSVDSPIQYAQVHKVATHPPVPNFASTYLVSPKVDKKIHTFDFDVGVKIHLDADDEDSNDEELDAYVAEIQRSITASPIPLESIGVEDLKPPEFFRSVSQNDDQEEENNDQVSEDLGDGPFEEHGVVVASIFEKKSPVQQCTVSKPKVMNRDSLCPSGLTIKQQAVSNLEMLSTLSAMSRVSPDLRSSKSPEPASLQSGTTEHDQYIESSEMTHIAEKPATNLNPSDNEICSFSPAAGENISLSPQLETTKNEIKVILQDSNSTAAIVQNEPVESVNRSPEVDQSCTAEKLLVIEKKDEVFQQKGHELPVASAVELEIDEIILKPSHEFSIEAMNAVGKTSSTVEKLEASEQDYTTAYADKSSSLEVDKQYVADNQDAPNKAPSPASPTIAISSTSHIDVPLAFNDLEDHNSCVTDPVTVDLVSVSLPHDVQPDVNIQKPSSLTKEVFSQDKKFNHQTYDTVPLSDSNADAVYAVSNDVFAAAIASSTAIAFETTSASISDPHNVAELSVASPAPSARSSSAVNDSDSAAVAPISASNVDPVTPSSKLAEPAESLTPLPAPSSTETKAPATGLVYSAEVKLEQPAKSSLFMQSAASPATPATKQGAPAPAVPAFIPAAATPAFVPGASSANATPAFGNTGVGLTQTSFPEYQSAGLAAANPASASQFTPRATIGSPSLTDKRKSANFNLAASGWGTYNEYYRPTSFAS